MKKRIGSKLYDTEKGVPVLPEKNLYKQANKRTFYLYDGKQITPLTFEEAADMIRGAGDPDLEKYLEVKVTARGCVSVGVVTTDHYHKLEQYARREGRSMKSIIESFIDSLPEA